MIYKITHISRYKYDASVSHCYNVAHVLPRSTTTQTCLSTDVVVSPNAASLSERKDYFGNDVCHFAIQDAHLELVVTSTSEVDVNATMQMDLQQGASCAEVHRRLRERESLDDLKAVEFCVESPMIRHLPALREYAESIFADEKPFLAAVMELTQRIFQDFKYDPESTTVATPLDEVLKHKHGVCQDFAHVAIGCMRALGFAARYVSGYIETLPPPGQEKLVGTDASHAWFAVYVPGSGWFDFDPTNSKPGSDQHITAAWGRDFSDVSPLKGVVFGGGTKQLLEISVDVARA